MSEFIEGAPCPSCGRPMPDNEHGFPWAAWLAFARAMREMRSQDTRYWKNVTVRIIIEKPRGMQFECSRMATRDEAASLPVLLATSLSKGASDE